MCDGCNTRNENSCASGRVLSARGTAVRPPTQSRRQRQKMAVGFTGRFHSVSTAGAAPGRTRRSGRGRRNRVGAGAAGREADDGGVVRRRCGAAGGCGSSHDCEPRVRPVNHSSCSCLGETGLGRAQSGCASLSMGADGADERGCDSASYSIATQHRSGRGCSSACASGWSLPAITPSIRRKFNPHTTSR